MWLTASSLYLAFLSFTDLWIFLYLALNLRADPLTLGIASSLWSVVFAASNIAFGRAIEGGRNKLAALTSSILLCLATFTTTSSGEVIAVVLAYSLLHAVSTSLGRAAATVTILEYVKYEAWSRYNYFCSYVTLIARGLLLILAYYGLLSSNWLLVLTLAVSALYSATLPPIVISIERTLFRLAKQLDRLHTYARFTSIFPDIVGSSLTASKALELRWSTQRDLPSYRPLLGVFLLVAASDALFIIVPRLFSSYIGRERTLLVYGLSSLSSALALVAISKVSGGRYTTLVSGLARALIIPSVTYIVGVEQAVAYLLTTSVLFNVFNTSSYNTYVTSSAGQRTFLFGMAAELGSATGSLIGGLLASYYGTEYVLAFSVAGHIIASAIAS